MPKAKKATEKEPRLGAWASRLLATMDGQRLCQRFDAEERGPHSAQFWLEPSGRRARPDAAKELIRSGRVRPVGDGLFVDAPSQTFELV